MSSGTVLPGRIDGLRTLLTACADHDAVNLPVGTMRTAATSLLDWLGCAVAGSRRPMAVDARVALGVGPGGLSVIGQENSGGWSDAILHNGIAGHVLDFDDMLPSMAAHPSAAVFPALLTLAEEAEATVGRVLAAWVTGTEVAVWVARHVLPGHYETGWHATGTLGPIASGAACAHLHGMSLDETLSAIDLAATQSAGMRALFGTVGKPLHAGRAALAGATATRLVRHGAASDGSGVLGETGFVGVHGGAAAEVSVPDPVSSGWASDGVLYKTYASCFMTQSVVDQALEARATMCSFDAIESIRIQASPALINVCAIPDPATSLEAKFSLHATTALALVGEDLSDEASLTPERLARPEYREMLGRIHLEFDDGLRGREETTRLQVRLTDGSTIHLERDRGRPDADRETIELSTIRKVDSLVGASRETGVAARWWQLLSDMDTPVPELMRSIVKTPAHA